jgi:hypothetical protein
MNSTFKQQLRMQNGPEGPPPVATPWASFYMSKGVTNSGVQHIAEV